MQWYHPDGLAIKENNPHKQEALLVMEGFDFTESAHMDDQARGTLDLITSGQ